MDIDRLASANLLNFVPAAAVALLWGLKEVLAGRTELCLPNKL